MNNLLHRTLFVLVRGPTQALAATMAIAIAAAIVMVTPTQGWADETVNHGAFVVMVVSEVSDNQATATTDPIYGFALIAGSTQPLIPHDLAAETFGAPGDLMEVAASVSGMSRGIEHVATKDLLTHDDHGAARASPASWTYGPCAFDTGVTVAHQGNGMVGTRASPHVAATLLTMLVGGDGAGLLMKMLWPDANIFTSSAVAYPLLH